MIRLYSYWRSSCSWRVRIALAHKGIGYEYAAVHLVKGEQNQDAYRERNPNRAVPLLEIDEGGQLRRIGQSMAIIEYLEERFPNPTLMPAGAFQRSRARQLAEQVNSGIQPLQNLMVLNHVESLGAEKKAWAAHWVGRGLEVLERQVGETAGRFCIGDAVTLPDLYLVPQLYGARRFGVDVKQFPTLLKIEEACAALPSFQAAHADRQPDAQPGT